MPWVARTTCVPQLEFFGPTVDQVHEVIDQFEATKREDTRKQNPTWTAASLDTYVAKWMATTKKDFKSTWQKGLNKNDLSILKNVEKFCWTDSWLDKEVKDMLSQRKGVSGLSRLVVFIVAETCGPLQKFSMSELEKVTRGGSILFLLQAADSYVDNRTVVTAGMSAKMRATVGAQQSEQRKVRLPAPRPLGDVSTSCFTSISNEMPAENNTDPADTLQQWMATLDQMSMQTHI